MESATILTDYSVEQIMDVMNEGPSLLLSGFDLGSISRFAAIGPYDVFLFNLAKHIRIASSSSVYGAASTVVRAGTWRATSL